MNINIPEVQEIFEEYELSMEAAVESMVNSFRQIRAGRANPYVLDSVRVDYYGTPTPINQMGNITVSEARVLTISVWDASALKAVEKAILASNIGLTPNNDGKVIRLIFPELTQERRQQLTKDVRTQTENIRVSIRNSRRKINDTLKKMKKDSVVTEDDYDICEKEVDKMMNEYIEKVDRISKEKEKEIMTV